MVLPGTGQSIERFRADEAWCKEDAFRQIGGRSAEQAQRDSAMTSAAVATAVGALAGAAIGGDSRGAAVGAGVGLVAGSASGNDAARRGEIDLLTYDLATLHEELADFIVPSAVSP